MSIKSKKLREGRNRPPADMPWVWFTREMLESDAWCSLSLAARKVIDRVILEHMAHAGTENGNLAVTYDDFIKFGIRRGSLNKAIREAVEKGLISITQKGRASAGLDRWPNRFALGWLPLFDASPAPNRWKTWKRHRTANTPMRSMPLRPLSPPLVVDGTLPHATRPREARTGRPEI